MNRELGDELAEQLRPLAHSAPLPGEVLMVPDEWVRPSRTLRMVGGAIAIGSVVAGASVAVLVALSFLGAFRSAEVGSVPPPARTPAPLPSSSEVAIDPGQIDTSVVPGGRGMLVEGRVDGRPFALTITRDADGVCLEVIVVQVQVTSCGALPGAGVGSDAFGLTVTSLETIEAHAVAGVVAIGPSSVVVETTAGATEARLVDLTPAGIDAQLFFVFLPGGIDADAWVAMSAAGDVIERFDPNAPAPSGEHTPDPTPASTQP